GFLPQHKIKISKIHLSSAMRLQPTPETRQALSAFADDTYLHQVVVRHPDGRRVVYLDIDDALACEHAAASSEAAYSRPALDPSAMPECRGPFHVPFHRPP